MQHLDRTKRITSLVEAHMRAFVADETELPDDYRKEAREAARLIPDSISTEQVEGCTRFVMAGRFAWAPLAIVAERVSNWIQSGEPETPEIFRAANDLIPGVVAIRKVGEDMRKRRAVPESSHAATIKQRRWLQHLGTPMQETGDWTRLRASRQIDRALGR